MEQAVILLPAFVMSALMIFSHTYFGLHVLARGIIFVDLALAQVAALGISLAFLFGEESHGITAQLYAFIATLGAAFIFSGLRRIPGKTTREVIIGCVYVVSTALSIVILSQSSKGMEELKSLLNGNILWVRWQEIAIVAGATVLLTIFHLLYRRHFHALSFESNKKDEPGFLWEFLFFVSFAVIITLTVNIAGILLVFAFLIIPAFSASLLSRTLHGRLVTGWLLGVVSTFAGLWVAFNADLPVGATVVSVIGLLPIAAILIVYGRSLITGSKG